MLTDVGVESLKQWTGTTKATVVYDSTVDEFTHKGLFRKVRYLPNIALIGFTTDGDVFGGFYSVDVDQQHCPTPDPDIFVFSLESHGRCATPQRFDVKDESKGELLVDFWKNDSNGFVSFTVPSLCQVFLGNERSNSNCCHLSLGFQGVDDTTLTGLNGPWHEGPFFHCIRLLAVQLE